jgi:3-hydroxyisobutyrate dehydrogenase-like beta-hydroxyacid dehydrogenase
MSGLGIAGSGRAARTFLARLRATGFAPRPAAEDLPGLKTLLLVPRDIGECETLLFEAEGFARNAPALQTIVLLATLSPRYVRALRGRIRAEIALVDAPFSGSIRAAEQGALTFFVGGRREDVDRIAPIFDRLGAKAIRMGGFGAAMAAKVMNDFLAASSNAMTRIALDWAEAQGIDEARLLDVTGETLGGLALPDDTGGHAPAGPGGDEGVTALVREVEIALDNALAGAHLTPPRALEDVFRGLRQRHLH